jgi:putative hydrolase of the HAD superfamily
MPQLPAGTRAVFFDAVGTLLFPEPSAPVMYAEVARRFGLELSAAEVRARFIEAFRREDEADRAAGWVTSEEREVRRWKTVVATVLRGVPEPEACFRELYDHFANPAAWRVAPDAGEVIARLRDHGIVVGLGSNYDSRLWPVLGGFPELAPLRDRAVVSAAVGFRKPAAEFFREVVRLAGCEPREVLFVGDDIENDYEGAVAAGLNAVLVGKDGSAVWRVSRLGELIQ